MTSSHDQKPPSAPSVLRILKKRDADSTASADATSVASAPAVADAMAQFAADDAAQRPVAVSSLSSLRAGTPRKSGLAINRESEEPPPATAGVIQPFPRGPQGE